MSNDSSNHQNDQYKAVPWGPRRAIATALIALVAGQILAGLLVISLLVAIGNTSEQAQAWSETTFGQFVLVSAAEAFTMGLVWLLLRKRGLTWASIGFTRTPRLGDGGRAVLVGVGYFAAFIAIATLAQSVFQVNVDQEQDIGFKAVTGSPQLIMAFISLVILPPVVEEVLFRGVLYGGLRKRFSFAGATLVTSTLFALPHALQGEGGTLLLIGAIDTFILSIALCYLREKTGSIWASIVLHMIKNGIAYLYLFVLAVV